MAGRSKRWYIFKWLFSLSHVSFRVSNGWKLKEWMISNVFSWKGLILERFLSHLFLFLSPKGISFWVEFFFWNLLKSFFCSTTRLMFQPPFEWYRSPQLQVLADGLQGFTIYTFQAWSLGIILKQLMWWPWLVWLSDVCPKMMKPRCHHS